MNRLPTIRVAALVLACGLTAWTGVRSQQPKTDTEQPPAQPAAPKAEAEKPKQPIDTENPTNAPAQQPAAPKGEAGKPKQLIDTENPTNAPAQQPAATKAAAGKPKQPIDTESSQGQPGGAKTAAGKPKELIDTENPGGQTGAPKAAAGKPKELVDTENPGNPAHAAAGAHAVGAEANLPPDALLKAFASYDAHQPAPGGDPARQIDGQIKQLSELTAFRYRLAVAAAHLRGHAANAPANANQPSAHDLSALKEQLHGEVEQARSQAQQSAKELKALLDGQQAQAKEPKTVGAAKGQPAKTED